MRNIAEFIIKLNLQGNGEAGLNYDGEAVRRQRIEFNPMDLAKYIDETGDEQGIVLAINELLDDGLVCTKLCLF